MNGRLHIYISRIFLCAGIVLFAFLFYKATKIQSDRHFDAEAKGTVTSILTYEARREYGATYTVWVPVITFKSDGGKTFSFRSGADYFQAGQVNIGDTIKVEYEQANPTVAEVYQTHRSELLYMYLGIGLGFIFFLLIWACISFLPGLIKRRKIN